MRIVVLPLVLVPETVIFVFFDPATALDGETEIILAPSFLAETSAQPFIIAAVKIADKIKQS